MNNRAAWNRIRVKHYLPFTLFKCQLQTCCNFITSLGNQPRRYCYSHYGNKYRYTLLKELENLKMKN